MSSARAKRQGAKGHATSRQAANEFWLGGRSGTLSAQAQAKVWALDTMSKTFGLKIASDKIAKEVSVIGKGKKRKSPSAGAVDNWRKSFVDEKDWYPNKHVIEQEIRPGPKKRFTGSKRRCIKQAAEAIKESGVEPTVNGVRLRCKDAAVNPDTGEFFDKK